MKGYLGFILAGFLVLAFAPAAAQAETGDFGAGMLIAQAPPGRPGPQGAGPQGGGGAPQGGDPCQESYQRCVMMCAGVGNCVQNCNLGYAACQQNRQKGK